jgi:hypothetical protein
MGQPHESTGVCCIGALYPFFLLNILKCRSPVFSRKKTCDSTFQNSKIFCLIVYISDVLIFIYYILSRYKITSLFYAKQGIIYLQS